MIRKVLGALTAVAAAGSSSGCGRSPRRGQEPGTVRYMNRC